MEPNWAPNVDTSPNPHPHLLPTELSAPKDPLTSDSSSGPSPETENTVPLGLYHQDWGCRLSLLLPRRLTPLLAWRHPTLAL